MPFLFYFEELGNVRPRFPKKKRTERWKKKENVFLGEASHEMPPMHGKSCAYDVAPEHIVMQFKAKRRGLEDVVNIDKYFSNPGVCFFGKGQKAVDSVLDLVVVVVVSNVYVYNNLSPFSKCRSIIKSHFCYNLTWPTAKKTRKCKSSEEMAVW